MAGEKVQENNATGVFGNGNYSGLIHLNIYQILNPVYSSSFTDNNNSVYIKQQEVSELSDVDRFISKAPDGK